jgi:ribulose-phosphate 3-epimerase
MVMIAPSIISADLMELGRYAREAEEAGADMLHVDVMDGCFVPNITIGPAFVKALKSATKLPLDVHLMINEPEKYVEAFAKSGASIITVHVEATTHLHKTIQMIKDFGAKAGVTLNPATPVTALDEIIPYVDMVLVMSVNPGFSGQAFIPTSPRKVALVKKMMKERGRTVPIEVDGGINPENAKKVVREGAEVLVSGSWLFRHPRGLKAAVEELRSAALSAQAVYV